MVIVFEINDSVASLSSLKPMTFGVASLASIVGTLIEQLVSWFPPL